jgi:hypothetical protein
MRVVIKSSIAAVVTLFGRGLLDGVSAISRKRAVGIAGAVLARVLGGAKVTGLVGRDDSVAAGAGALADCMRKPVQRELVIALCGVALGLEEGDFIHAANRKIQRSCRGAAQRDAAVLCRVYAAEVNGKSSVNEGPNIVVAGKVQYFTARVRELVSKLAGK